MNVMHLRRTDTREFEYWTPAPFFKGQTVFCLASGPSLTREICEKIRDRSAYAIVVNSSAVLALEAGLRHAILFFTDSGWYEQHRELVANWPEYVISLSRTAKREMPDKVLRVKGEGDPSIAPHAFPAVGSPFIRQGRSSGHTAISLAIALGASRVAMLGFDMRPVPIVVGLSDDPAIGSTEERAILENSSHPRFKEICARYREHHHSEYQEIRDLVQYERDFVPCFNGWNAAALRSGVQILNCTPGSAVTEFPFADLDEVLTCVRS